MRLGTFVYRSVAEEKWRIRMYFCCNAKVLHFSATWIMKMKDYTINSLKFMYNWSLGLLRFPALEYQWQEPLINLGEVVSSLLFLLTSQIIELLHHVHAHEIFLNGEFNGDPHPGNILLLNDGRVGLIDYGQVTSFYFRSHVAF